MKIGICGYGVVGQALGQVFPGHIAYDPAKNLGSIEEINTCDIVFICVPTPPKENGDADLSIVEGLVAEIKSSIIVIKSTVPPKTCKILSEKYNKTICFNPEFLTEANAMQDMLQGDRIIVGGDKHAVEKVHSAYETYFGTRVKYLSTDSTTAEVVKYLINSYLALKVSYVNQMHDYCNAIGVNWAEARSLWLLDQRIGDSHTQVSPERGFSGKCFPKDVMAVIKAAEKEGVDLTILRAAWNSNCKTRPDFHGWEL